MLNTDPDGGVDCHFKQTASRLQNFWKLVESLLAACLKWNSALPLGFVLNIKKLELKGTLKALPKLAECSANANALSKLAALIQS